MDITKQRDVTWVCDKKIERSHMQCEEELKPLSVCKDD